MVLGKSKVNYIEFEGGFVCKEVLGGRFYHEVVLFEVAVGYLYLLEGVQDAYAVTKDFEQKVYVLG